MDTQAILNAVDKLHADATKNAHASVKIDGVRYTLEFNGRNYVARNPDGSQIAEFNTRQASVAKTWLREYLAN